VLGKPGGIDDTCPRVNRRRETWDYRFTCHCDYRSLNMRDKLKFDPSPLMERFGLLQRTFVMSWEFPGKGTIKLYLLFRRLGG